MEIKRKKSVAAVAVILAIILISVAFFSLAGCRKKKPANGTGDGVTVSNPMIWSDAADPDVIRVGNDYYMVSTTMHLSPGCPVLKSSDLKNWRMVNYVYDVLDDSDALAMRNGANAYSQGSWAATLRYHDGYFYGGLMTYSTQPWHGYFFRTRDIENGKWERAVVDPYYDMSLLFDGDKIYVVYSGGGDLYATELELAGENEELSERERNRGFIRPKAGGIDNKLIIPKAAAVKVAGEEVVPEGAHIYKIDGKYYVFMISHSSKGREQFCFRSDVIDGDYEGKIVLCDNGVAQGGIFDTPKGEWYSVMFQDHGAVGRIPFIVPVKWKNGWCEFGENGKVPESLKINLNEVKTDGLTLSDEFGNGNTKYFDKRYNFDGYSTPISGMTPEELNDGAGTELIANGNFEGASADKWQTTEKGFWIEGEGKISLSHTAVHGGNGALRLSERADRGEGIRQKITGIKRGRQYSFTAAVYYDGANAKEEKSFNFLLRYGALDVEIGNVTVKRGEWGVASGTFTVPATADVSEVWFIAALPFWFDEEILEGASAKDCLSDLYFDDISIVQQSFSGDYYRDGEYDYNGSNLGLQWQWNHNPDNRYWSLTEREGYLRLKNGYIADGFKDAKNTLTQRSFGPFSSASVAMETGGMKDGDWAGLGALQDFYGFVGVTVEGNQKFLVKYNTIFGVALEEERIPIAADRVYLKVDFKFTDGGTDGYDRAYFYYSLDGENWTDFGGSLYMVYRLDHFVGYRFALFSYATKETGGYADFDYFRVTAW